MPHGTSLRMGRWATRATRRPRWRSATTASRATRASLQEALTGPYPPYEAVGIRNPGGEYNQLATSLLQIENEFYGTIRPKRVIRPGERPLHALRERGVEYVEVRCMDLDPFVPVGISAGDDAVARRVPAALPARRQPARHARRRSSQLARNQQRAAAFGREPGLELERDGTESRWSTGRGEIDRAFAAGRRGARRGAGERLRRRAAPVRRPCWASRHAALGARAGDDAQRDFDGSFVGFVRAQSEQTRNQLLALPFGARAAGAVRGRGRAVGGGAAAHRGRRHDALRDLTASSTVAAELLDPSANATVPALAAV